MTSDATVLVVDDEQEMVRLFANYLSDEYEVLTATTGEEALDKLHDGVDAVLLDRRMPGLSGDEVLNRMEEEGYQCPVAMITAIDPDFDIIEMGFLDYLVKPVDADDLKETVENLLALAEYESHIHEYVSLSIKDAALQRMKDSEDLEHSDDYRELKEQVRELSLDMGDWSDELSEDDFDKALRMVMRNI